MLSRTFQLKSTLIDKGTHPRSTEPVIDRPEGRQGHAGVWFPDQQCLVVFGGRSPKRGRHYLNDCWKFFWDTKEWKLFETHSEDKLPVRRHNHSCVRVDGFMYLFGGQTDDDVYLNDFWRLDLATGEWVEIRTRCSCAPKKPPNPYRSFAAVCPLARHAHGCVAYKNSIIIFGGRDGYQPAHFGSDCWIYDIDGNQWSMIQFETAVPPGRSFPSCVVIDDRLIVFGGYWWDGHEHYLNDTWSLHIPTKTWTQLVRKSEVPHARNRNNLTVLPNLNGVALMFGGNHFDSRTRKDIFFDDFWTMDVSVEGCVLWERVRLTKESDISNTPIARGHHLVVCLNNESNEMILFGGEAKTLRYNDVYSLQLIRL